jgi:hypothetical protein
VAKLLIAASLGCNATWLIYRKSYPRESNDARSRYYASEQ